jgi:hypothetical protein
VPWPVGTTPPALVNPRTRAKRPTVGTKAVASGSGSGHRRPSKEQETPSSCHVAHEDYSASEQRERASSSRRPPKEQETLSQTHVPSSSRAAGQGPSSSRGHAKPSPSHRPSNEQKTHSNSARVPILQMLKISHAPMNARSLQVLVAGSQMNKTHLLVLDLPTENVQALRSMQSFPPHAAILPRSK